MILLAAVIIGLIASLGRSQLNKQRLKPLHLQLGFLVVLSFIPQLLVFYLPITSLHFPDNWASAALLCSQIMLLGFVWCNRNEPGFWALGLGLALNLLVIMLNGGLMPISPDTLKRLLPNAQNDIWQMGQRVGTTKDILMPTTETKLRWLSDQFILPEWIPYRVAFSIGDIFISIGSFWLLWSLSDPIKSNQESL